MKVTGREHRKREREREGFNSLRSNHRLEAAARQQHWNMCDGAFVETTGQLARCTEERGKRTASIKRKRERNAVEHDHRQEDTEKNAYLRREKVNRTD